MITVKHLREHLATLPDDLPIVITWDFWQHEMREQELPKVALWDGAHVGAPKTQKAIDDDRRILGDDECLEYTRPCVCIGWIE